MNCKDCVNYVSHLNDKVIFNLEKYVKGIKETTPVKFCGYCRSDKQDVIFVKYCFDNSDTIFHKNCLYFSPIKGNS